MPKPKPRLPSIPDPVMTPAQRRHWVTTNIGSAPKDFDGFVLQTLADGPILDPLGLYLPAGKLTQIESRKREKRLVSRG